jgi:hypothetical protein
LSRRTIIINATAHVHVHSSGQAIVGTVDRLTSTCRRAQ